jgi:hypothetical protein
MEEIIRNFIEWAEVNAPDAWWLYENTDEAIEQYMKAVRDNKITKSR